VGGILGAIGGEELVDQFYEPLRVFFSGMMSDFLSSGAIYPDEDDE
jgi:hypothetical protein